MARILGVGIATLDIINQVTAYPAEDSEIRATGQRICRGGNATNTLVVLAQLGHQCHWAGSLAEEPDSRYIEEDLHRYGVDFSLARRHHGGKAPTSYILLSSANGSRSIVHYRDLAEYDADSFRQIDLTPFQWLHFEGRAPEQLERMLRWTDERFSHLPVSLEVEKPRDGIEKLFGYSDIILFSRHYAQHRGFSLGKDFLFAMREETAGHLVVAWGEEGAWCLPANEDSVHHAPAHYAGPVVDTLAAGDTFNAGVIHGRSLGWDWPRTLAFACRLAGEKVSREGLSGLGEALAH